MHRSRFARLTSTPARLTVSASLTLGALLAFVALLAPRATAAQDRTPPVSGIRVAGEVGLGLVGTPVGFVAGGLATRWVANRFRATEESASRIAMVGAWTGAALVTAAGPTYLGTRGRATGSYPAALGGAVAGGIGSLLLVKLNTRGGRAGGPCGFFCSVSAVSVFLLPSVGATVGLNMSRRYER
ncbi:MAG: hypothetical protein WKG32_16860 [Gemmatimonadaceae bacterium]